MDIAECAELLKGQDNILIISHLRPDGDTLGSSAALCHALRRLGKTAWMYPNTEATEKYLPYVTPYYAPCGFAPKYFVAVDTAEMGMTAVGYGGNIDLCIDHHPSNSRFAAFTLLDPAAAANCEIMCDVIHKLGVEIDKDIANCIYTGLATDTGCFRFSNTRAKTLRAAAEMLDCGAATDRKSVV